MLGLRDLWLMPLLAELVLMLGAGWMAFCLLRTMQGPKYDFPIGSVVVLAIAYAVLAIYSRLHELFLPRKVVLLGVGTLLVVSASATVAVMVDAYLLGGARRLATAALAMVPLHLFNLRCLLIFREARFAPAAEMLAMRMKSKSEAMERLRRKLHFWLS